VANELQLVAMQVSYSKKLQVHYPENILAFHEYGQKLSPINVKSKGGGDTYSSKDFFIAGKI
jgi:hypothetical protein